MKRKTMTFGSTPKKLDAVLLARARTIGRWVAEINRLAEDLGSKELVKFQLYQAGDDSRYPGVTKPMYVIELYPDKEDEEYYRTVNLTQFESVKHAMLAKIETLKQEKEKRGSQNGELRS